MVLLSLGFLKALKSVRFFSYWVGKNVEAGPKYARFSLPYIFSYRVKISIPFFVVEGIDF